MANRIATYIVDSFTDQPFKGNPAGVCLLDHALPEQRMLQIAQELGLSETAFVESIEGASQLNIRYFSPKMEIPLCGHATLASAKVLFSQSNELEEIHFITKDGLDLHILREGEWIVMEFPTYDTQSSDVPQELLNALGLSSYQNCVYNQDLKIFLLEIADAQLLASLAPDFPALLASYTGINGVLVTARSVSSDFDFESRYFWPWSGTNEDPVTGGTHTFLAPYWAARLKKTKMRSFQSSARTGFMEVELREEGKMKIRGKAQLFLSGEIFL